MMKTYYTMLHEEREAEATGKMKQFATYFTHGIRNGAKLRAEIYAAQDSQQILDIVDAFFDHQLNGQPIAEGAAVA
jgi:tRNA-dihydrouridine synthase